jgi:L-fucose mutarotase/ribose pyranase (RbsD/FucU family)
LTDSTTAAAPQWERELSALLPLFGHRNWIVVADSAYPAQSKPGIETIVADADQLHVVRKVLDAITAAKHIRANIHVDKELGFVPDMDAPGIADYRLRLEAMLAGSHVNHIPHERIIHMLDQSAMVFRILIIKTDMTIPYTSVFFELDCGYWNAEAEERLREAMPASDSR